MATTKWHCEFIADFEADRSWLGKAQVMRIRRLPLANHTCLCCDELQMSLVTQPLWLGYDKLAFVDATEIRAGFVGDERECILPQLFGYRRMLPPAIET